MKTPEEIKKGLDVCGVLDGDCENCPYDGLQVICMDRLRKDALAYIQQLEAGIYHAEKVARECAMSITENMDKLQSRLAQVELERDAAVKDISYFFPSPEVCAHYEYCQSVQDDPLHGCLGSVDCADYQYRGVCALNTKEEGK